MLHDRRSLSILSRPRHPGKSKEERPGSSIAAVTASFVPFHHVENARCTCVSSRETTRGSRTEEKTRWEWKTERKTGPREEEEEEEEEEGKKKRGIIGEGGRGVTRLKKRRSSVSPEEKLFGSWSLRRANLACYGRKVPLLMANFFLFTPSASDTFSVRLLHDAYNGEEDNGEKRGEKKKKKATSNFEISAQPPCCDSLFFDPLEFTREINEN